MTKLTPETALLFVEITNHAEGGTPLTFGVDRRGNLHAPACLTQEEALAAMSVLLCDEIIARRGGEMLPEAAEFGRMAVKKALNASSNNDAIAENNPRQAETQDEIEEESLAYLREVWAGEDATAAHADDLVSGEDDFSRQMRARHEAQSDE